jgi:hypothetical protein
VGESGDTFEYYAWGGVKYFLHVGSEDNDKEYARLQMQINDNGVYKCRDVAMEVIERFLEAPEGET